MILLTYVFATDTFIEHRKRKRKIRNSERWKERSSEENVRNEIKVNENNVLFKKQ